MIIVVVFVAGNYSSELYEIFFVLFVLLMLSVIYFSLLRG